MKVFHEYRTQIKERFQKVNSHIHSMTPFKYHIPNIHYILWENNRYVTYRWRGSETGCGNSLSRDAIVQCTCMHAVTSKTTMHGCFNYGTRKVAKVTHDSSLSSLCWAVYACGISLYKTRISSQS